MLILQKRYHETVNQMKISKFLVGTTICSLTMMAVSTVFMNQAIFLELANFFDVNIAHARMSFTVVSLSYSVTFLLVGPTIDRVDLPKIAFCSALLLAMILMGTSFVTSYHFFLFCMLPMGFCAALIPASMFPYMSRIAPDKKKGLYVGSIVAAGTLGVIFGRVLSGIFTSLIDWQGAYRLIAMLVFICSIGAAIFLPRSTGTPVKDRVHLVDAYKKTYQLVFKVRVITLMLIGGTLFFGFLGIVTFLSYRLNNAPFNFTAGEIGWISFAGITALIAPLSGQLAGRFNIEKIIICGLLFGLISILILGWALTTPVIAIGLLLLFLSVYTCQPLIFMMVGNSVSHDFLGSASSLYIFFCIGGGSLASIFLGPIWTTFGWYGIVSICSGSIFSSMLLMLLLTKKRKQLFRPISCG